MSDNVKGNSQAPARWLPAHNSRSSGRASSTWDTKEKKDEWEPRRRQRIQRPNILHIIIPADGICWQRLTKLMFGLVVTVFVWVWLGPTSVWPATTATAPLVTPIPVPPKSGNALWFDTPAQNWAREYLPIGCIFKLSYYSLS